MAALLWNWTVHILMLCFPDVALRTWNAQVTGGVKRPYFDRDHRI